MLNENRIPEGYMENAQGCLVPLANIRPIDLERDALVKELIGGFKDINGGLRLFKRKSFGDIDAFVQLSGERYDVKIGGGKGNVTLVSFDGRYKVVRAYSETLAFDEGLIAAKELIDECLREWCAQSRPELRAVVEQAFKVDKKGRINTAAELGLRRLEIADERWQRAMQAIGDSLQVCDTKGYIRAYERDSSGAYQPISLDFASV